MKSPGKATNRNPHQRIVITGMGAITPVGNTVAETWEALKAGRSGLARFTLLDPTPWARQVEVNVAVSNSFGLGGQNAVLVLRRVD